MSVTYFETHQKNKIKWTEEWREVKIGGQIHDKASSKMSVVD